MSTQLLKFIINLLFKLLFVVLIIAVGYIAFTVITEGSFPPKPQSNSTVTTNTVVLQAIKQVNKQTFIEHYMTIDVQYSEAPAGWIGQLGLKQEMLVLIRGRVPAGFDLQQLSEQSVWVSQDGKKAQLTLPAPIIFNDNVNIDFKNSRVLTVSDLCPDLLCPQSTLEAYNNVVMPEAQAKLIAAAQENGILNQAAVSGRAYYEQLLKSLGFEEVRVVIPGYD